jgi:hypothetical protein
MPHFVPPVGSEPGPVLKPATEPPPLISGSVIGYRAWRIKDWQLTGTGVDRAWAPGVQEATCDAGGDAITSWVFGTAQGSTPHRHSAPAIGCHCGINALARFTQHDEHWKNADVFGAIEAWGENEARPDNLADAAGIEMEKWQRDIVRAFGVPPHLLPEPKPEPGSSGFHLHRNGFRARYAKVVLLAVEDDWPAAKKAAVRALAREHEADVCKREHLEDAAKEHGQLVPDELLEWVAKSEPTPSASAGGGYLVPSYFLQAFQQAAQSASWGNVFMPATRPARQKRKPRKPGISQTLGYPGPPANPSAKFTKGQRVADSKAVIWTCVKGGKPGLWEREQDV